MLGDGVHHDWRFPVNVDKKPEERLELFIQVVNVRNLPDNRWLAYLIALGALGAAGTALYVDADATAAAVERVYNEVKHVPGLSSLLGDVLDAYISLFRDSAACAGLVFEGSLLLDPNILESRVASPAPGGTLGGQTSVSIIPNQVPSLPIVSASGCGQPSALVEVDVERHETFLFDPTPPVTVKLAPVRNYNFPSVEGVWVDDFSVNAGTGHRVHVTIKREQEYIDLLRVKVLETAPSPTGTDTLVNEEFSGVYLQMRQLSAPPKDHFAARSPGLHPEGVDNGGVVLGGRRLPNTGEVTYYLPLRSGEYGRAFIVLWQKTLLDTAGRVIRSDMQMDYTRTGYRDLTNTGTWISHPRPVE
jgi:hypothetical protein